MFNVICLETGAIVAEGIEDGTKAAAIAREHTETSGKKHQPRRVVSANDWREREAGRFTSGAYKHVPWIEDDAWELSPRVLPEYRPEVWAVVKDHYVHVSTEEPGKLAFTASDENGVADRQTRMKPGRYLTQFYPFLDQGVIKIWANRFAAKYEPIELLFSEPTSDDIERVYTNGPTSCMSHRASTFSSPMHPVRVYGAGDLRVAYLATKGDGDDAASITARALVYDKKMKYGRIYGDEDRLGAALEKAGYCPGSLDGARMLRIEHRGAFVVPYIDGSYACNDDGAFLVIMSGGEINCETTNGLSERGIVCDHCGAQIDENDSYYLEGAEATVCECCYNDQTFYCDYTEETCEGESVRMANGEHWSQDAFENHGFECEGNNRNYPNDECVVLSDGTVWSQSYFEDHGSCCDDCNESFACEDVTEARDGSRYCADCMPDEDEADTGEGDNTAPSTGSSIGHKARQGRDESPNQRELVFSVDMSRVRVGDRVTCSAAAPAVGIGEVTEVDVYDDCQTLRVRPDGMSRTLRGHWVFNQHVIGHAPQSTPSTPFAPIDLSAISLGDMVTITIGHEDVRPGTHRVMRIDHGDRNCTFAVGEHANDGRGWWIANSEIVRHSPRPGVSPSIHGITPLEHVS